MARAGAALEDDLYRGTKIGRYEILTQLTTGGMAEIFLGFTTGPGGFRKYVVVKRILPDVKDNDQVVNMFLDEARITAAFSHPNIGQVFDLGVDSEGHYLVMEFIAGQNLNQVTAVCARTRTVLPLGFSVSVVHDLALALHYAHNFTDPGGTRFPVVHRDVAQKNVMVTYEGVVKLLDFGIAKARGSLGRTSAGTVKGTTGYMSPEQVRGDTLDGRSDVFSLGVVLWEMSTGQRLFSGNTERDEMKLILEAPIRRPRDIASFVPEALEVVTLRALARERADRFNSAKDLAKALEQTCAQVMFDQDQRATFMRELFTDKMAATQALLQTVQGPLKEESVLEAVKVLSEGADEGFVETNPKAFAPDTDPVVSAAAVSTTAPTSPKASAPKTLVPKASAPRPAAPQVAAAAPRDTPVNVEAMRAAQQVTADQVASEERSGKSWLLVALMAAIGVGTAAGLWKLNEAPEEPGPAVDYSHPVPIPVPPELRKAPPPVEPPAGPGVPTPSGPPVDPPRPPPARQGSLTLITVPDAEVFLGKQRLGQTPLFSVAVPAGTHKLTLIGPDKVKRLFSVPVKANENAKFRIELEDLPKLTR